MKTTLIIIGSFAAIILLAIGAMVLRIVLFPVNTATKLIDTAYDAQSKVLNADNAIYNYEWFKQKKADIDASKIQLQNAQSNYESYISNLGPRKDWTFEDKTESARLNSVVFGLQNYLQTQIADYNARTSMATRNIFENSVLPRYIDALTFIKK